MASLLRRLRELIYSYRHVLWKLFALFILFVVSFHDFNATEPMAPEKDTPRLVIDDHVAGPAAPPNPSPAVAVKKSPRKTLDVLLNKLNCDNPSSYQAKSSRNNIAQFLSEASVLERTRNCDTYFDTIRTVAFEPTTKEERDFPLAFAYTTHSSIGILEMFLAVFFRPTDSHCIHIDNKASEQSYQALHQLVGCYNERFPEASIFVARKSISVFWGFGGSIMEADMICYRELKLKKTPWKMVANVAGTELPFVSIQRFREKLRSLGGNVMAMQRNNNPTRADHYYVMVRTGPREQDLAMRLNKAIHPGPPPCGIKVLKGIKNGAFTRDFITFATENRFALALYNWLYNTGHPCEHFTATLGSLSVERKDLYHFKVTQRFDNQVRYREDDWTKPFKGESLSDACYQQHIFNTVLFNPLGNCTRLGEKCSFNVTAGDGGMFKEKMYWTHGQCYRSTIWFVGCKGKLVRGICHFAVEDLVRAKKKHCLIGNKFSLAVDPAAIACQVKEVLAFHHQFKPGMVQNGV